jgi:predicted kinase
MKKLMLLIGTPLSGKSTFIRENYPNTIVISRDELVMEVFGSNDYNKAFKEVNHKEVDKLLDLKLKEANLGDSDVIIDMTNLVSKRRISTLNYFSNNFYKEAIVFPFLTDEEYLIRNNKRNELENKFIPMSVIQSMKESYVSPILEEGFDKITNI